MSSRSHSSGAVSRDIATLLGGNRAAAVRLLDLEEPFIQAEVPEEIQRLFIQLLASGVLTKDGTRKVERYPDDEERSTSDRVQEYRLAAGVDEWIEGNIDESGLLPCRHEPFRNVRDGAYSCLCESCDRTYTRAQIEAVLDGGEDS